MVSPAINMWNTEKHSGVSGIPTQLLVLHSAECPLRGGFAQSLTQWASVPLAQGGPQASWQRFVDPIARVRMIDDNYAAWHASEANPMSIGWEQAGYARFTRAEWLTPEGLKQLDNLAYDMAEVAKRDGIPPVWLTFDQVTAVTTYGDRKTKGFCAHRQIDPETRTDPGNGYPYDLLMDKIKSYMGGLAPSGSITPATPKESEVPEYKRVTAPKIIRRLAKGLSATLMTDKTNTATQNFAVLGLGHYDVDLFLAGTDLPLGETVNVQFVIIADGVPSGYFTTEVHGSADGTFSGSARFKMPILSAARLEAKLTSSVESANLTSYAADVYCWPKV